MLSESPQSGCDFTNKVKGCKKGRNFSFALKYCEHNILAKKLEANDGIETLCR